MQDNQKLEVLLARFYERYNKYNTDVLKKIGEAIKKIGGVSPSAAHKIAQELKYGKDLDELVRELEVITEKSVEDIYEAFGIVAKDNLSFAETYAKAKNMEFVRFEDNEQLKSLVNAIAKETAETFINISNTYMIGFNLFDKQSGKMVFKPLKETYYDVIDEAVYNVARGVTDYQSAMRKVIKKLALSGVKTHEEKATFESGYNRRIDSQVRLNVLEGVRRVNIKVQEQVGSKYGADAVEISAHSPCAEDHIHLQGRQFTKKEFEKINENLKRPIGTLNCRHFVFAILKGVNEPSYTNEQLYQMERESHEKVEYEGKEYTMYEATQVQRKIETKIRRQKDSQIIARASGDHDEALKAQSNIRVLVDKYYDFSEKVGLEVYKKRLAVSGYHRIK